MLKVDNIIPLCGESWFLGSPYLKSNNFQERSIDLKLIKVRRQSLYPPNDHIEHECDYQAEHQTSNPPENGIDLKTMDCKNEVLT